MDSARVSAVSVATPERIRANTKSFTPTTSVSQAYSQASQPSNLDMFLDVGAKVLDYAIEVDEARQDMALKAAMAERSNHLANWNVEYQRTAFETNEKTGRPNYESYEEEFANATQQADAIFRDKYRFSGKNREMEWKLNNDSSDTTMRGKIVAFTTKQKTAEALVDYEIALKSANTIDKVVDLNNTAMANGTITPGQAKQYEYNWQIQDMYKREFNAIDDTEDLTRLVAMREEMQDGVSVKAVEYGDDRRAGLIKEIDRAIENHHRGQIKTRYDGGGGMALQSYLDDLQAGGPEATFTSDMVQHDAMMQKLSLIHISEPTRRRDSSRMPSSA